MSMYETGSAQKPYLPLAEVSYPEEHITSRLQPFPPHVSKTTNLLPLWGGGLLGLSSLSLLPIRGSPDVGQGWPCPWEKCPFLRTEHLCLAVWGCSISAVRTGALAFRLPSSFHLSPTWCPSYEDGLLLLSGERKLLCACSRNLKHTLRLLVSFSDEEGRSNMKEGWWSVSTLKDVGPQEGGRGIRRGLLPMGSSITSKPEFAHTNVQAP